MPAAVNNFKKKEKKTLDRPAEPIHGPAEPIHGPPPPLRRIIYHRADSGLPPVGLASPMLDEEERRCLAHARPRFATSELVGSMGPKLNL